MPWAQFYRAANKVSSQNVMSHVPSVTAGILVNLAKYSICKQHRLLLKTALSNWGQVVTLVTLWDLKRSIRKHTLSSR